MGSFIPTSYLPVSYPVNDTVLQKVINSHVANQTMDVNQETGVNQMMDVNQETGVDQETVVKK